MRISLINGEDTAEAYNHYISLIDGAKKKGFDIIPILDIKQIVNRSLFEDKVVFTLERPKKISLSGWRWLKENSKKYNSNLLIYWDGNTPATVTKLLPKETVVKKFDLPKIMFKFIESFYPGNSKVCIKLLNELSQKEPIELILHLLSLNLRELYWAKISPETLNLPSWRKSKVVQRANYFSQEKLKEIIAKLSEIDLKAKASEVNLKDMLDMLIVKDLQ